MLPTDLAGLNAIVGRIDVGESDPATSRALVVFNTTASPLGGVAVFEATMTWPVNQPLPFIAVVDTSGRSVATDIPDIVEGPDPKGRAERRLLAFPLRFAVEDVPPQGWRTYLAFYGNKVYPPDPEGLDVETQGLTVVETTRHGGDLPPVGTF